jgi:hypothetical protein
MKKTLLISIIIVIIILTTIFLLQFFGKQRDIYTRSIDSDKSGINKENLNSNIVYPDKVLFDVPFTPQAPFGNWEDVRQDYGCEEASILMVMYWALDKDYKDLTPQKALEEIVAMAEFEEKNYGHFHDTSTQDTLKVLKDYFNYDNAYIEFDIEVKNIKSQLAQGNLVIVPIDGTRVNNPYYTPPGPFVHMIVIIGYNEDTQEFITHDPGTKNGKAYRYSYDVLKGALMDYKTGLQEPISEIKTAMLVVKK